GPLAGSAAAAIAGGDVAPAELYLWHGITPMLLLSIATFALGIVFFLLAGRLRGAALPQIASAEIVYQAMLGGMQRLAVWQTRRLQNGKLRGYMRSVFGVLVVTIGAAMLVFDVVALPRDVLPPRVLDYAVIALLVTGAIATAL